MDVDWGYSHTLSSLMRSHCDVDVVNHVTIFKFHIIKHWQSLRFHIKFAILPMVNSVMDSEFSEVLCTRVFENKYDVWVKCYASRVAS